MNEELKVQRGSGCWHLLSGNTVIAWGTKRECENFFKDAIKHGIPYLKDHYWKLNVVF